MADNVPEVNISMECTDTEEKTESGSLSYDGSAPIIARFSFTVTNDEGWDMYYEWRVCHEKESLDNPYIVRKDENPEITFTQAGTDSIALYAVFTRQTPSGGDTVSYTRDYWGKTNILTVKASTSVLTFPNAFSPNGDGLNDTFRPKTYKSIVDFHAIIVNRWGQKLYEWNDVRADGWDGRFNGHDVKQGTYFIYCKAKGADGTTFEIRKDVNLLRSYDESVNGSSVNP